MYPAFLYAQYLYIFWALFRKSLGNAIFQNTHYLSAIESSLFSRHWGYTFILGISVSVSCGDGIVKLLQSEADATVCHVPLSLFCCQRRKLTNSCLVVETNNKQTSASSITLCALVDRVRMGLPAVFRRAVGGFTLRRSGA